MPAEKAKRPVKEGIEHAIKQRIMQRTGGRIQTLEVVVTGECINVRGRTVSFHLKQLALQGILDVIGSPGPRQIEVNVQVERNLPGSDSEAG
jgi:hypothetical protein